MNSCGVPSHGRSPARFSSALQCRVRPVAHLVLQHSAGNSHPQMSPRSCEDRNRSVVEPQYLRLDVQLPLQMEVPFP